MHRGLDGGVQSCMEVCGGAQRFAEGCIEGCVEVHRGLWRGVQRCMEVSRGYTEVCRGSQRGVVRCHSN